MHSSNPGFQSKFSTVPVVLLLLTIWLLMHGYHGLTGDGRIYAFQAFARLHPQLANDLYLQNTSQDQFTLFSPLYAWCIGLLGLENSARLLTLSFGLWFLAGTWSFARAVTDRDTAWAGVAYLLILAGYYGSSSVFRILEPFLTARLPAEALIITALACHVRGKKRLSLLLSLAALLVHPLIALPGLLFIICLWLPFRASVVGAIVGVVATLAIAVLAVELPTGSRVLTVMDAPWLDVVRERSQFLFLQLWSVRDWETNAQPFLYLGFTAIVVTDQGTRKLCAAAALVGAAGLAVALIGGLIGPVAILVQGQAWRWIWITVFVGALLVPFTALQAWRDDRCGPLCALLLISGWTLPGVDGMACVGLALTIWLAREHICSHMAAKFRWLSAASLGLAIVVWTFIKCRSIVSSSAHTPLSVAQIQEVFALRMPAVMLGALLWWGITTSRRVWVPALLSLVLAAFSALIFSAAFKQPPTLASAADVHEFADWAAAIPPTSAVLVVPPHDAGAFVWFTLARPNYLTLDQSAGAVFSRATALEVRRRSEILLPLMDPDWKILTKLRARSVGGQHEKGEASRPLTAGKLIGVCADPQLGFVISPEKIGFNPLSHEHAGTWKDWNLYDCRKVRSALSPI
jgi:hypothetical protein